MQALGQERPAGQVPGVRGVESRSPQTSANTALPLQWPSPTAIPGRPGRGLGSVSWPRGLPEASLTGGKLPGASRGRVWGKQERSGMKP